MKKKRLDRTLAWLAFIPFLLACLIPSASAAPTHTVEVMSQSDLATIIAGTANAAQAKTASALPTSTHTFTPTWTPSTTPTSTPTFLYLLPTATPVPSETPIPPVGNLVVVGSGTSATSVYTDRPWTCLVTGSTPPRNVAQKPGEDFYITWTVMNTGTKEWWNNGIDFVYESGYRTEQRAIQDLPKTVYPGGKITLKILLTAPKQGGETYNVIWILKVGNKEFCRMRAIFKVEE